MIKFRAIPSVKLPFESKKRFCAWYTCLIVCVSIFCVFIARDSLAADPLNNKKNVKSVKTDSAAKDQAVNKSIPEPKNNPTGPSSGVISDDWDKAYNAVLSKISQIYSGPPSSENDRLQEEIFSAIGHLTATNSELNIRGLPEISMKLIARAENLFELGNIGGAKKILTLPQGLSPNSSSVFFGLSRFVKLYGIRKCADLFLKGLIALTDETVARMNLICFFLLIVTTTIVVAILIVCLIQIISNLDDLQKTFSLLFPVPLRRFVAPLALSFVLIFALAQGLLVAIIVWSLLLGLLSRRYILFHVLVGLIMIGSFIVFCFVSNFSHVLWGDVIALENINKGYLTPRAIHDVAVGTSEGLLQDMRRATLGYLLLDFNKLSEAEEVLFDNCEKGSKSIEDIRFTNLVNKGALLLAKRDIFAARTVLRGVERDGDRSFELFLNLSQVSLAAVEMEEYRRYATLARNIDPDRFESFEMHSDSGRGWLPKQLPYGVISDYIWSMVDQELQGFLQRGEGEFIFKDLSPFTSLRSVITFFIVELIVFFVLIMMVSSKRILQSQKRQPSHLWLFLPTGYQLISPRPVQATIGLGSMIGLLWIFGYESKNPNGYLLHLSSLGWNQPFAWAVAAIYCFFAIIGIWQWSRDTNV